MLFGYGYGDSGGQIHTEADPFAPSGTDAFEEHLAALRSNEDQVLRDGAFEGVSLRYRLFYGIGAGDGLLVDSLRKRRIPVLRDAGPLSWIYIDDAMSATAAALTDGIGGEAYNVVDDEPVSWTTMMAALADALGAPRPRAFPRWLLGAAPYLKTMMQGGMSASNSKLRRALHWAPSVPTFRAGVTKIAAMHSQRRGF